MSNVAALGFLMLASIVGSVLLIYNAIERIDLANTVKPVMTIIAVYSSYVILMSIPAFVDGGNNPFIITAISLILMAVPSHFTFGHLEWFRRYITMSVMIGAAILFAVGVIELWSLSLNPYTLTVLTVLYIAVLPFASFRSRVGYIRKLFYKY